jgi:hypothetical protein
LLLAAIAFGLTAARARLGLAFTLAVPVFPLGNVSSGLAIAYAGIALAWLGLMWRDPRRGLLFASGIALGPAGLLGLVPLAVMRVGNTARRAALALAAVLLAGAVAGLHGSAIPFSRTVPRPLGVAESDHPLAVLQVLWQWLSANPELGGEALVLAAAAAALPYMARRTDLSIAAFAAALLAGTVLGAPRAAAIPLLFTGWLTYLALTLESRRHAVEAVEPRRFGPYVAQTRAHLLDRLKAAGGPRWPRPHGRFGQADAR